MHTRRRRKDTPKSIKNLWLKKFDTQSLEDMVLGPSSRSPKINLGVRQVAIVGLSLSSGQTIKGVTAAYTGPVHGAPPVKHKANITPSQPLLDEHVPTVHWSGIVQPQKCNLLEAFTCFSSWSSHELASTPTMIMKNHLYAICQSESSLFPLKISQSGCSISLAAKAKLQQTNLLAFRA